MGRTTMKRWVCVLIILLLSLAIFACSEKADNKPAEKSQPQNSAAQAEQPDLGSPEDIWNYPIARQQDLQSVYYFDRFVIVREKTQGTLPVLENAGQEYQDFDQSLKMVSYAALLQKDIDEIQGFFIGELPEPSKMEKFPPKNLEKVRVTLYLGPVEYVNFGLDGVPELEPLPGQEKLDKKDAAPDIKHTGELKKILVRSLGIDTQMTGGKYYNLEQPIKVDAKRGMAMQLVMEVVEPYLYPTVNPPMPNKIGLLVPNKFRISTQPYVIPPLAELEHPPCFVNPTGAFVCMYLSGVMEMYVVAPFESVTHVGHWSTDGGKLIASQDPKSKTYVFDIDNPRPSLSFGKYGTGFVAKSGTDPRLHPLYDASRAYGGEPPISPNQFKDAWLADIDPKGELELVTRVKSGGVMIFKRDGGYSQLKLLHTLKCSKKAEVQVVFFPMDDRAYIGIKEPEDELWSVHGIMNGNWEVMEKKNIPWNPWD